MPLVVVCTPIINRCLVNDMARWARSLCPTSSDLIVSHGLPRDSLHIGQLLLGQTSRFAKLCDNSEPTYRLD